ncbi:MAG TPA: alpha-galactosidase [Planctomycetes bacterium]|nr:alpha-galactosidase [Planctomycetota bacterium]
MFACFGTLALVFFFSQLGVQGKAPKQKKLRLEDMDLSSLRQDWGNVQIGKSVDGHPLRIGSKAFKHGLGSHAAGVFRIELDGKALRFRAWVGVDSEVGKRGSVFFRFLGDGKELFRTKLLRGGDEAVEVDLPLQGVRELLLLAMPGSDGIDYDHADWGDPYFLYAGEPPKPKPFPREEAVILTPPPGPEPRIRGPRIFGVRPGSPLLYRIPATGNRPMTFSVANLPAGLELDPETGILRGRLDKRGTYNLLFKAENKLGSHQRGFRLVVGDKIALTPPMGWNSWNCWATSVDDNKIRASAKAMVESGLADHGWQYINIDDCWMVKLDSKDPVLGGARRDKKGRILSNKRFPDMKALTDYIHSLGLKAGLYTSPGPYTCAGFEGAYGHEEADAKRFADWGFDYLKYDLCGYRSLYKTMDLELHQKPYRLMGGILRRQKRDIVFSICQYGLARVWEWGEEVGGNCWRTTGDIVDTWGSVSSIGFGQHRWADYAGPGHWNDPDMLVLGKVGWGPRLHPSRLTPNEQYSHMSLWCLLSAPLLLGNDLSDMDPFTLNLLTNDEVLEVNQDPLGNQAKRLWKKGGQEIWAKKMEDGSQAVGLFNRDEVEGRVTLPFQLLGWEAPSRCRDLWRQKDLAMDGPGFGKGSFSTSVPRHGVVLLRVFPPEKRND